MNNPHICAFSDIFEDDTKSCVKIPALDYNTSGKYPIIDQGQNDVAGYTDREEGIYSNVPVIIFGDHTRQIKYQTTPFFVGADGVKVLKRKSANISVKYLYYCLQSLKIEDHGYSRHFKFLKEKVIRIYPSEDDRNHIVQVLDTISTIIEKRKQQIAMLDELEKSLFVEMFGDPVENPMEWDTVPLYVLCSEIYGGGTPSKSHPEYYSGNIPWVTPKDMKQIRISDSMDHISEEGLKKSTTKLIPADSIIMVIRSGILKHTLPIAITSNCVTINQDMKAFVPNEKTCSWFLLFFFKAIEPKLLGKVKGTTADNIEFTIIRNYTTPMPPITLQNKFSSSIDNFEKYRTIIQSSLIKMQETYNALMQQYFG